MDKRGGGEILLSEHFEVLDKIHDSGMCMWAAAPELNKAYPELSRGHCNKIVLDWIKEKEYHVSYTQDT